MSLDADAFSIMLLEEAKRFLEKADEGDGPEHDAYLHAALIVGFSALESHINGIADELSARAQTDLLARSILEEKQVILDKGHWKLGNKEQFFRLEDRISYLLNNYYQKGAGTPGWWSELMLGIKARNGLVHPRSAVKLESQDVQRYLIAIIEALNDLYNAVFGKGHPSYNRQLQSTMIF